MSLALVTALVAALQGGDGASTFEKVAKACSRYAWGAETADNTVRSFTLMGFIATGATGDAPLQEFALNGQATQDHVFFLDAADPIDGQTGLRLCMYYPAHQDSERLRREVLTQSPAAPAGMERRPLEPGTGWLYGDDQLRLLLRIIPDDGPLAVSFTGQDE